MTVRGEFDESISSTENGLFSTRYASVRNVLKSSCSIAGLRLGQSMDAFEHLGRIIHSGAGHPLSPTGSSPLGGDGANPELHHPN